MRLFIAVPLPESLRAALAGLKPGLARSVEPASWVRPEAMHLTLRFLGDVQESEVPELAAALAAALAPVPAAEVVVVGGGGFPPRRSPRVLWVGLRDPGVLAEACAAIDAGLDAIGFAPRDKPFRPHLTLCRLKGRRRREVPEPLLELGEVGRFAVREVVLFRSELLPQGARHTRLHTVRLGEAP